MNDRARVAPEARRAAARRRPRESDRPLLPLMELQRSAGNHATIQAVDQMVARRKSRKKRPDRAGLVAEATRGAGFSDELQARIAGAMEAFSEGQLERMVMKAGLRFWHDSGLPPELGEHVETGSMSTNGEYLAPARVIRLRARASRDDIRHELGHAWDSMQGEKRLVRLEDLDEDDRIAAMEKIGSREESGKLFGSSTKKIVKMYESYKARVPRREEAFDNPGTREGYSTSTPKEFYAEGYSVFHGTCKTCQAKLLAYAPELYDLLEKEAKREGLGVPDRAALAAENRGGAPATAAP